MSGGDKQVNLGERISQLLPVTQGQASGDDQECRAVLRSVIEYGVYGFLDRWLDERAGVHDHDLRTRRIFGVYESAGNHNREDTLRIHPVLRASETY
jgi:hypothetical protein